MGVFVKWRILVLSAFLCLAACGDDDSDFISRPDGKESSSSSICKDCGDESSSSKKQGSASSSSSVTSSSSKGSSSSTKSSSSVESSSSEYVRVQCDVESDENCMKDDRDGQTYRTTKIGNRVWMAENLNYAYLQPTDVWDSSSKCYRDSIEKCEKYGRYYLWSAAMDSVGQFSEGGENCGDNKICSILGKVRGVCPKGWHLPSENEWKSLIVEVGDSLIAGWRLKATSGWFQGKKWLDRYTYRWVGNGDDAFGFTALPASYLYEKGPATGNEIGSRALFWSSTEISRKYARYLSLFYNEDSASVPSLIKDAWLSVRCVMDDEILDEPWRRVGCRTDFEDNCEYGELTDDRDGQIYKTVKVGDQWWMAENLNYAYYQHATADSSSFCYDGKPENCEKDGRLYWWFAAMDGAGVFSDNGKGCGEENMCSPTYPVRGVCPEGWHLPDATEWKTLLSLVGNSIVDDYYITFLKAGMYLKVVGEWGYGDNYAMDSFGFSVHSSGYRYGDYSNSSSGFWSSKEYSSSYANYVKFSIFDSDADLSYLGSKNNGHAVRCVKD